ncbi:uncharacterized protein J4E79_002414 [Alternaria viburni]|uniref:uncharacterized protein n=1 Tax=Alternaria viburni TaxID=566460 RepID=UPI0020C4C0DA|nr:uncharacterized protein J4E79_002414 [Alternaria viburni]KAI4666376.1 hypothetical protein J4E79_002414 [Alternaria viburni]
METAAPAKRQWKGRTDEQKAERARKRQQQKTSKKPTKVQRVFTKLEEWKPEDLGFKVGIKEIEFGPDFVVQE